MRFLSLWLLLLLLMVGGYCLPFCFCHGRMGRIRMRLHGLAGPGCARLRKGPSFGMAASNNYQ